MPVRLGSMLKIIPSSSLSPRGRRDYLCLRGTCFRISRTRRSASLRINLSRIGLLTLVCGIATARLTSAAEPSRDSDYDYDPPAPGSYRLPIVKVAPDGALLDSAGKPLNLRDLTHGRVTIL